MMRAKMRITSIGDNPASLHTSLVLSAVCRSTGYPADGSDEDNTFAKWTPSASLNMQITNPELYGKFAIGQEFYVDFTPVLA